MLPRLFRRAAKADAPAQPKEKDPLLVKLLLTGLELAAFCLVIFLLVKAFIIHPYLVVGSSMDPTLINGEEVYVNQLSYKLGVPKRGDIVVLNSPLEPDKKLVKRIIGLPGERLEIRNDGQVIVIDDQFPGGIALREDYLHDKFSTVGYTIEKLGDNEYFVMGDNRLFSSDSRGSGGTSVKNLSTSWAVNQSALIGKVLFRSKPSNKFTFFQDPKYNF